MTKNYDVLIVGGGPSGLSAALMFGSAVSFVPEAEDKTAIVIDAGHSDAKRAQFFNAPGLKPGLSGDEALEQTRSQLHQYSNLSYQEGKVRNIERLDEGFSIEYFNSDTKSKEKIKANKIILATGFRSFGINGLDVEPTNFKKSDNPTRVQFEHNNYQIENDIYVCGLLSGDSSQWPIVTGSGAQVAINIISEWAGAWKVMHDKV